MRKNPFLYLFLYRAGHVVTGLCQNICVFCVEAVGRSGGGGCSDVPRRSLQTCRPAADLLQIRLQGYSRFCFAHANCSVNTFHATFKQRRLDAGSFEAATVGAGAGAPAAAEWDDRGEHGIILFGCSPPHLSVAPHPEACWRRRRFTAALARAREALWAELQGGVWLLNRISQWETSGSPRPGVLPWRGVGGGNAGASRMEF